MTQRHILLVDDDARLLDGLRRALRREPFTVRTATSAAQALEILDTMPLDVIVSDEQMPIMRGTQLLIEVRQRFPEVVRILLTGRATVNMAVEAVNRGQIFKFLTKPCPPDTLAKAIRHGLVVGQMLKQTHRPAIPQRPRRWLG